MITLSLCDSTIELLDEMSVKTQFTSFNDSNHPIN